jgi:hypothetical protein
MEMKTKRPNMILVAPALLALLLPGAAAFASPVRTSARILSNFADEGFKKVWTRTDALVDNGSVKRSYFWGPVPGFTLNEDYAEGPGGKHLVQYFDKSRMEINNPNGDRNNQFFVTNGLLTRELISGRMQTGNNQFVTRYPAEIDIASDTDDTGATTPTYASFSNVTYDYGDQSKLSQTVLDIINRAGQVGTDSRYASYGVKYAYFEPATRHNIPDVFWSFLNASGPIMVNGKQVNARFNDPYFYATGFPIADAYWASVKIAGVSNTAVLIQPYERRVLTYVPTAPEGFKVQMGNIGQHYYDWRYNNAGKPTSQLNCQTVPIRGFGKIWAGNSDVRGWLGCPFEPERGVSVAHEYFEHGEMIDVIETYAYGPTNKTIYVLFDDNSVQRFQDNYVDGDPEPDPSATPPPGLYTPTRGFGKVWREGTGARVRERLGWATEPGTIAIAPTPPGPVPTPVGEPTATPVPSGLGGAIQSFEHGMMVYSGPVLKTIYVLYNSSGYGNYDVTRWAVYNDYYTQP